MKFHGWNWLGLAGVVLGVNSAVAATPHATGFCELNSLTDRQRELIEPVLQAAGAKDFDTWAAAHDGLAASFLSVTHALTHLSIRLKDGRWIVADEMLRKINHVNGDRIFVELDTDLFDSWRDAGAEFLLIRANGKQEHGNFHFDRGDWGGSLHHGSDIQGYTSYSTVPRIQINYQFSSHEADIDLDGYAPWIDGFIPDPFHLTWQNSDTRYWPAEYQKSFGNPCWRPIARKRNVRDDRDPAATAALVKEGKDAVASALNN